MEFIPDKLEAQAFKVPYFEDAQQEKVAGYDLRKPINYYQNRIVTLLSQLGAMGGVFTQGQYPGKPIRYGYRITFNLGGIPGRIDCAALPIRSETSIRKEKALKQSLFLVGEWLQGELAAMAYRPGAIPLVAYLVGPNGKTVTESLLESKMLPDLRPMLPSGAISGQIVS